MRFRPSPCVGLIVPQPAVAAEFYAQALGMHAMEDHFGLVVEGVLRFYLDPGSKSRMIFELFADDLEEAQSNLPKKGFSLLTWRGQGESNFVRDPWGLIWNVYEQDIEEPALTEPDPSFLSSTLGGTVPNPQAAAEFYAALFDTEAGRLLDNSHVVDAGEIRLRFRKGETEPLLWLSQDVPDEYLDEFGFKPTKAGYWLDPFGFHWARPVQVGPVQAAVEFRSS